MWIIYAFSVDNNFNYTLPVALAMGKIVQKRFQKRDLFYYKISLEFQATGLFCSVSNSPCEIIIGLFSTSHNSIA
jgi:hypothetical protein